MLTFYISDLYKKEETTVHFLALKMPPCTIYQVGNVLFATYPHILSFVCSNKISPIQT